MSQSLQAQLGRYLLVGCAIYAIDVGLFWAIVTIVGSHYYLAVNCTSKITATAIGFALHRSFTFRWQQEHGLARQSILYGVLFLFNVGLSTVLLFLCVGAFFQPPLPSKIVTDAVIAVTAFMTNRHLVFRSRKRQARAGIA